MVSVERAAYVLRRTSGHGLYLLFAARRDFVVFTGASCSSRRLNDVEAHWAVLAYEHRTRRVRIIDSMPLYLPDRVQELAAHLADLADRWNGFSSGTVTVGNMECVQAQQESECGVMALNGLVYVTSGFFGSLTRKKYVLQKQHFKVRAAQALGAPR